MEYRCLENLQNSHHYFCAGDEVLKFSELGASGGMWDLMFTEQKGNLKLSTKIRRKIENLPSGTTPWSTNAEAGVENRLAEHHFLKEVFSILKGKYI